MRVEPLTWGIVNKTLLVGKYTGSAAVADGVDVGPKTKIAGFDLDDTLIHFKEHSKKEKQDRKKKGVALDWEWWHPTIPSKLRCLHDSGHRICIFTNQAGLGDHLRIRDDKGRLAEWKNKVASCLDELDIPVMVYAATGHDQYRKPRRGMWDQALRDLEPQLVDTESSYLVGDAAGRKRDFADTDWGWALNTGTGFFTPEEFFLNKSPEPQLHRFDPSKYLNRSNPDRRLQPFVRPSEKEEMIVLVGLPASGKSTFYRRHLMPQGYAHVSIPHNEEAGSQKENITNHINDGRPVVIDGTNPDKQSRRVLVNLAKKLKVPIRCIYFKASPKICWHNDVVRLLGGESWNPEGRTELLPKNTFKKYWNYFKEPLLEEGFQEIIEIDFEWEGTDEERVVWGRYWT